MKRRDTGILGEQLAKDFLKKKKYKILKTNYRCSHGEIDIIARQKDTLVFVEVRTKTSSGFGSPAESITRAKREHLIATAYHYIQTHEKLPESWRIDFIGVELDGQDKASHIEHIENAVGE